MDDQQFITKVERLIKPIDIGALHFLQTFNRLIPAPIILRLLRNSSNRSPYMGFVVEPYSLFLFHKITDIKKAKSLLPKRFRLIKTKVYSDDTPEHYVIIGTLNTHTSGFWGIRQETYLIAEDTETGLLSWIIIDVQSNTLGFYPTKGVVDPNSTEAVFTTNAKGVIYLDIEKDTGTNRLKLQCDLANSKMRALDQRLWLEGNHSIDYSLELGNGFDEPFAVIFDPIEVERALDVPLINVTIEANDCFQDMMQRDPTKVVCFPYAQHYFSDSPGHVTHIKNKSELLKTYKQLRSSETLNAFDAASIRRQFIVGIVISTCISTSITIFLIAHFIIAH